MEEKQLPQRQEKSKPQISNATVKKPSIANELMRYAVDEVLIPQSKDMMSNFFKSFINMFSDAATKSIDKAFYKDEVPRRPKNGVGTYQSHVNYAVYSKSNNDKSRETIGSRSSIEVNYIWVDTEAEAKTIVGSLVEDIEMYGKATVASLYEMVHVPTTFSDFKFGWTKDQLRSISYYRDRGKYFIDLPKPVNIENS